MNDINNIIEAAIQKPREQAVREAVNKLLGESVKAGQTVALIDPETIIGGYVTKGVVKGMGENPESGFVDVELENGTVVKAQSSLLIPV